MPTLITSDKPWFNFGGCMGESSATVLSLVALRPSKSDSGFFYVFLRQLQRLLTLRGLVAPQRTGT